MTRKTLFFILAASFALTACGGSSARVKSERKKVKGDRTMVSHSDGVEPIWIQECPANTEYTLVFCGESHEKPSQKSAYTEAQADALGKLGRFVGQKIDAKLAPDGKGGYNFQIEAEGDSNVTIRGAWEGERWCEEYDGPGGRTHDCYVMVTYPKFEYDRLVGTARKVARQRIQKARDLFGQAKDLASKGKHQQALTLLQRAKELLSKLRQPQVIDGQSSEVMAEQIMADLKQEQQAAKEILSTALVVVGLTVDGKLQTRGRLWSAIRNKVQKWVVDSGLKIRPGGIPTGQVKAILSGDDGAAAKAATDKGAGMLLVLDLKCNFSSELDGAFYSYAEGGLRLIRTADGREIFTAELPSTKGGHISKNKANKKAIDNLLNERVKPAVKSAVGKISVSS